MSSLSSTADARLTGAPNAKPNLDHPIDMRSVIVFLAIIGGALGYTAYSIYQDVQSTGAPVTSIMPFLLLGVALLIALGFEFVNGFHDTANAVATVIYTHSLPANFAVVWSGLSSTFSAYSPLPARSPSPSCQPAAGGTYSSSRLRAPASR